MPSQKLMDEIQAICYRNRQIIRRQELFDADPTCKQCTAKIEKVEDCGNMKMQDGSEHLVHNACFQMQIEQMALNYFGRPRLRGFGSGLV